MVTIHYDNIRKEDYLIFYEEEFAEKLFTMAKQNIVEQAPTPD